MLLSGAEPFERLKRHAGGGRPDRRRGAALREDLGTGYGLRFPTEIYGRKWFSTKTFRKPVLFLQTSLKISGNLLLWEFTGECTLGILYSSSLSGTLPGGRRAQMLPAGKAGWAPRAWSFCFQLLSAPAEREPGPTGT